MNSYFFYTKLYGLLRPYEYIPNRLFSPLRFLLRKLANYYIPRYLYKESHYCGITSEDIIVSLTSFPARIDNVWKVIRCMKLQDTRPRKIILWLSKEQFLDLIVPDNLLNELDDMFSIEFVEGDIRSHKKYFYAIQKYPQSIIVTIDDDVFYRQDTLSSLIEVHKEYPNSIIANTTSFIAYNNNELMSYNKWKRNYYTKNNCDLLQIGIGGVLYPPHCLHPLTFEKDVFMQIAPLADDIWLNAMARLKGTRVIQSKMLSMALPIETHSPSLSNQNVDNNMNDIQIKNIRAYCLKTLCTDPYYRKS